MTDGDLGVLDRIHKIDIMPLQVQATVAPPSRVVRNKENQ